jgi:hypothetical protein
LLHPKHLISTVKMNIKSFDPTHDVVPRKRLAMLGVDLLMNFGKILMLYTL